MIHPYTHTMMPLHLAKRMIEQRGGEWRIESWPFLEIMKGGEHLGSALIADDVVRFLDITRALASRPS
ncbi:hypothetical protein ACVIGB_000137 [Bradyrhizobium sp. USDA 4341]